MLITKKALPRRTFLRGVGAVVGLPLLEAMVPALTATAKTAAAPKMRFSAVYIPHGAIMDQYTPKAIGRGFEFTPILKSLEPFRDSLMVISNLDRPGNDDSHATASAAWLSGAIAKKTEGQDFYRGSDGRLHRLRGRLQSRVCLRVHEHVVVGQPDVSGSDGDQPPRGVRAAVRTSRNQGTALGTDATGRQRARFDSVGSERSAAGPRAERQGPLERVSRERARDRASDSADGSQERVRCRRDRLARWRSAGVCGSCRHAVGPARGGPSSGPDPRLDVHDGPGSEHEDIPGDRTQCAAPHDLAPR